MAPKDETLENTGIKKPNLSKMVTELQQAQTDSSGYITRMGQVRSWWMCEWPNQTPDGRAWSPKDKPNSVFPWDGCSDSRLRIVDTIIKEHVTLCLAAFWSAKKQIKSIRPLVSGAEVKVAQHMLDWRLEQMNRELMSEVNMALLWRFGGGLSFIKVEWEQQRELSYVPIDLQMIGEMAAALGLGDVMDRLLDPDKMYDDELIKVLQGLSPVLPTAEARTVLNELRESGKSELPVASLRINKPKWTAKRPIIDVLFPSETSDIQQTRFTAERELVSEVELTDRIVTDGYDDAFVEEALKHKGVWSSWWTQSYNNVRTPADSNRALIELTHMLTWKLSHDGTPCLYRTVFNEASSRGGKDDLVAVHRKFEYDHGQIPLIALRRDYTYRALLSSRGIAEESYTDEYDIKTQQDGLNNRTELIHQPPMIVPTLRAQAAVNAYGPRSIMTAIRPESVVFPPLPPMDQTPVIVMQMVQQRLDRRYPITGGAEVDPEIKALNRQQLTQQTNGELDLALDQTHKLQQQYETDEDIAQVAGGEPHHYSRKDIQGEFTTSSSIDINLIDKERAGQQLDMLAKIMPFKQSGGKIFNAAAQIAIPDLADEIAADEMGPQAMERERADEYNAIAQIMGGIEPVQNQMANPQFRLQVIQQITQQPQFMQEISQKPNSQKMLEKRVQAYQAQIQQFQENPQIGRALSTQTFSPQQAPNQAAAPAQ